MQYYAKFNDAGERQTSIVEGIHFKTKEELQTYLDDGFIEISEADQELYATNKYIRGADGTPQEKPPYVPTAAEKLATLDSKYKVEFNDLKLAFAAAQLDANEALAVELKQDYNDLKAQYDAEKEVILNG